MAQTLSPAELAAALAERPGWAPGDDGRSIRREFTFADHIEAMGFVNRVALAAEKMDHHPELTIVYNRVSIALSTHDAGGVTNRDLDLAAAIDRYAR